MFILVAIAFFILVVVTLSIYFSKDKKTTYPDSSTVYISPQQKEVLPYTSKGALMHEYEMRCYAWLHTIVPVRYEVIPQVLISKITSCYLNESSPEYFKYRNKINRKTVDFVIFEKESFRPILVIEYDGHTHTYGKTKKRDKFIDKVFETINMPIVHIIHSKSINYETYKNEILSYL